MRACTPAPGAWTTFRGERLKLGPLRLRGAQRPRAGRAAGRAGRRVGWAPRPSRSSSAWCSRRASAPMAGRRLGPRGSPRAGASALAEPAAAAPARAGRRPGPRRGLRTAARGRRAGRLRQPGAAGPASRRRGLAGRDAALATELGYGTLRALGTLDEILARVHRPRAGRGRGRRARRAPPRAPTRRCAPASRRTPRSPPPSTSPARSGTAGPAASSTPSCAGVTARTWDGWADELAAGGSPPPRAGRAHRPPGMDRRRVRRRAGRRPAAS